MNKIKIIFDPYNISYTDGIVINNPKSELDAHQQIDSILKENKESTNIYIIKKKSCNSFLTFKNLSASLDIIELNPILELKKEINKEFPAWLNEYMICELNLLEGEWKDLNISDWEEIILDHIFPGIGEMKSFESLFKVLISNSTFNIYKFPELKLWVRNQFDSLLFSIPTHIKESFLDLFCDNDNPNKFLIGWARKIAFFPIRKKVSLKYTPSERGLIKEFPLIFPLSKKENIEVSKKYCEFLKKSRIEGINSLDTVMNSINALWDGLYNELEIWLDITPNSLNDNLFEKIKNLPGYNDKFEKLLNKYKPPSKISNWTGIEDFTQWTTAYSSYIKQCFLRYELPDAKKDPANGFSRWVKDNYGVIFNHSEYAFFTISQYVKEMINNERNVIIVMIDAFAIHLVDDFIQAMNNTVDEDAEVSYAFSPVPTTTEICKHAIVTGKLPNKTSAELSKTHISKAYDLEENNISLISNWDAIKRFQHSEDNKLIVYRENRVDDVLHSNTSYGEALDEIQRLFKEMAKSLKRFINEMTCINNSKPLLIITADHGFTFLPNNSHNLFKNNKRYSLQYTPKCNEDNITLIPKQLFHLKNDYYALIDRDNCNADNLDSWKMTHGGLLPEEVIIPVIKYFSENLLVWPDIDIYGEGTIDIGKLSFKLQFKNPHNRRIKLKKITINLDISEEKINIPIGFVESNDTLLKDVLLNDIDNIKHETLKLNIILFQDYNNQTEEILKQIDLPIKRMLMEKTSGENDFEDMFP